MDNGWGLPKGTYSEGDMNLNEAELGGNGVKTSLDIWHIPDIALAALNTGGILLAQCFQIAFGLRQPLPRSLQQRLLVTHEVRLWLMRNALRSTAALSTDVAYLHWQINVRIPAASFVSG